MSNSLHPVAHRNRERLAGALFLLVFVFYGAGVALLTAPLESPDFFARLVETAGKSAHTPLNALGGLLLVANSVAVVVIATALYPVFAARSSPVAAGYLGARIAEAALLASGGACLLAIIPLGERLALEAGAHNAALFEALSFTLQTLNNYLYQTAMLTLGVGGVSFCAVCLRAGLLPKPLAMVGIAGYAGLALGAALEFFGVKAGIALAAAGGAFELALGIWLLAKGFAPERRQTD